MSTASQALAGVLLTLTLATATAEAAPPPRAAAARPITPPHTGPGITPGEAARIRFQVQQHHHMQRRAAADGEISRHEHIVLARDAAQVRQLIHTARRN